MKEITHDDLCRMKLHEVLYDSWKDRFSVLRVPGGWIYTSYSDAYPTTMSSCFVPYCTEVVDTPVLPDYADDIL